MYVLSTSKCCYYLFLTWIVKWKKIKLLLVFYSFLYYIFVKSQKGIKNSSFHPTLFSVAIFRYYLDRKFFVKTKTILWMKFSSNICFGSLLWMTRHKNMQTIACSKNNKQKQQHKQNKKEFDKKKQFKENFPCNDKISS